MKLSDLVPSVFTDGDDPEVQITTKKYSQFPKVEGAGIEGVGLKDGQNVRFELTTDSIKVNPEPFRAKNGQFIGTPEELAGLENQRDVNNFLYEAINDIEAGDIDLDGYATEEQLKEVEDASVLRDEVLDGKIQQESNLNTAAHLKLEDQIQWTNTHWQQGDEKLQEQIDAIEFPDPDLSGYLPLSGGAMETSAELKVNTIAPVNTPSIFYSGTESSHPMGLMNRGMISDFIDDKTDGLASVGYVDNAIEGIELPETDLSDYATIEYVDDVAESIAAILDFDWSDLGGYTFHRAADYPGSGIIQCKVPGGAPQASSIQKLMVHKTNADGFTNDIDAVLKAGNTLKLSKGQNSEYYKIVDSRVLTPNVELDVKWLSGADNKLFLNDRIIVQEGAIPVPEITKSRITTQVRTMFSTQAAQGKASFIDGNGNRQYRPDNAIGIEYTISRDHSGYVGDKDWWRDDYEPLDTGYIQVIDPFTGKVSWAAGIGEVTVNGDTIRWMVSGSIYTNYPDFDANRDYFLNLNGCLEEK